MLKHSNSGSRYFLRRTQKLEEFHQNLQTCKMYAFCKVLFIYFWNLCLLLLGCGKTLSEREILFLIYLLHRMRPLNLVACFPSIFYSSHLHCGGKGYIHFQAFLLFGVLLVYDWDIVVFISAFIWLSLCVSLHPLLFSKRHQS